MYDQRHASIPAKRRLRTPNGYGGRLQARPELHIPIAEGSAFYVDGVAAISRIHLPLGAPVMLVFMAAGGTLVSGSRLLVPGGSITIAAGDTAWVWPIRDDIVRVVGYTRADGTALVGGTGNLRYDAAQGLSSAQKAQGLANLGIRFPDNTISGLGLANGTDATNDIDISTGWCADTTNVDLLVLGSALTKQLDAGWAVGNNQGGRDAGSIVDGTWHVFLIKRSDTGVVDALFSLDPSAPTMPSAAWDRKRRIGSIIRKSNAVVAFKQDGDYFTLVDSAIDLNASANPGTSAVLRTLTVPTGIRVIAGMSVTLNTTNLGSAGLITDPATNDATPSSARCNFFTAALGSGIANLSGASLRCRTNTSAQVRSRISASDPSTYLSITTFDWYDTRGRA